MILLQFRTVIPRKLKQCGTGSFHQIAEIFSNTAVFGKYPHNPGFKKSPYSKCPHKKEVSITFLSSVGCFKMNKTIKENISFHG